MNEVNKKEVTKKNGNKKDKIVLFSCIAFFVISVLVLYSIAYKNNKVLNVSQSNLNEQVSEEISDDTYDRLPPPDNVKSLYLTPGVDFYLDENASESDLEAELDKIVDATGKLGFNSIIVKTKKEDKVIHKSEIVESTNIDVISMLSKKAKEKNIGIYTVLSVYNNKFIDNVENSSVFSYSNLDNISKYFSEFYKNYNLDGILLDDYTVASSDELFLMYKEKGSGIGYENWIRNMNSYFISDVTENLKDKSFNPIGIYAKPVWANKTSDLSGSNTNSGYQSFIDGFSDTKLFLEEDYVDFVLVETFSSLSDPDVPFQEILDWWDKISSDNQKKYYTLHTFDKLNTSNPGWNGTDQIVRQVSSCMKMPSYSGSVFSGYKKLISNENGATAALIKFYGDNYNESDLFKDLSITSPKSTYTETHESTARFMGKYDPNFDVFINDEKIIPTSDGEFLMDYNLEAGENKFEVKHKGKSLSYTVFRRIQIIKTVAPTGNLSLEGGSRIDLDVVAHRGASITASLKGISTTLKEFEGDDDISSASSYVKYKGSITLPKGSASDQKLGNISVYGKYSGLSESKYGASVTVEKIPQQDNSGGEIPGVSPVQGKMIEVTSNYADVFNSNDTASYADARRYTLPKSTLDYYSKTANINGTSYYVTKSGRRIKASESKMSSVSNKGNNSINSTKTFNDGVSTSIIISQKWKVPFDISHNNLPNSPTISNFNSTVVSVTFDYTTAAPNIDLSGLGNSSLFSSAKWEKTVSNNIPQFKLNLTLRKAGAYYGASSHYDGNGNLVIKFNNAPKSLSGLRVVIDPGHGLGDSGAVGSYVSGGQTHIVHESTVNWNIANELKNKLEASGAIVKFLDTKNNNRYTGNQGLYNRVYDAQAFNPHISLAVHSNSASSNTATGVESYYNTPFSKPLAKSINDSLGSYYNGTMYNDGKNRNRGDKFSEFLVTRVKTHAAVLLEYGFVSTPIELQKLVDPRHISGLAQATVNGLSNYVNLGK